MPHDVKWLAHYTDNDAVAFRIGRSDDELVAEWVGTLRLFVPRDGGAPRFDIEPQADPYNVAKIRRGSAQLLLRHVGGKLAMHGAAVAIDGRAVVFLGRSGQGKSTLAASVCSIAGATFLADDAVALDPDAEGVRYVVSPLEVDHWLDDGARRALASTNGLGSAPWENGKAPIRAKRTTDTSVPLAAFVELAFDGGSLRADPIVGIDAMACLVPQVVRFIVDEPARHQKELEVLARLVSSVPFFRLSRPIGLEQLDRTAEMIVGILESTEG